MAVVGLGLEPVHPPGHGDVASRIRLNGTVVADYPPETDPEAADLPLRNRIISGLAAAVVAEAGKGERGADHGGLRRRAGT